MEEDVLSRAVIQAYGTSPDERARGHYSDDPGIQAAAEAAIRERYPGSALHGLQPMAPSWFWSYWHNYVIRSQQSPAALAVDRNFHAVFGTFCTDRECQDLIRAEHVSAAQRYVIGEALEKCARQVSTTRSGERPDCALFAVGNAIVWQGRLPWE